VCCAGYCASPANQSTVKLAFGIGSNVGYKCYANEPVGNLANPPLNILPDFSFAGYGRGGVPIPSADPFGQMLTSNGVDDTAQIQDALDDAGDLAAATGGTYYVLLSAGEFRLSQQIWIRKNGVVLRGSGQGSGGTVLYSTKMTGHTLIRVAPHADGDVNNNDLPDYPLVQTASGVPLTAGIQTTAVPVGATRFTLEPLAAGMTLNAGDKVAVVRTPNEQWLAGESP
jgi:hypothetical protein